MTTDRPYAEKKFAEINGVRMAYIDEGEGAPIVFQHGNPTSSYLWRNVMPHLEGLGRLIACDLVGMGDSGRLSPSGPDRYSYQEQRDYLFALWDHLDLGDEVVLVVHDWGSALGFDWAHQHQDRIAGIAYMEAIVAPRTWEQFEEQGREIFQGFRSPAGEAMVLTDNVFVERVLPAGVLRTLTDEEMAVYRAPYLTPGESRRPTLSWPRHLPIEGEPADVVRMVEDYGRWLAGSAVPKLFINAEPGAILTGSLREFCRSWPKQTEVTVSGRHYVQEDSPDEIGTAVADFVRTVRGV
ncbi:haloalkane dehalogenase [Actinacidiphila guanduensis]|uniref:Haloalkane dehalogenase n=1 Tax=Actinacidiphila guanduensis TaxID=310781 RepID=A0A1G9V5J6_9ACTN|nr:haloalkane dehalogenase [Actinacidiphila guanduensis]SDM67448.1 haloalkane dehalogenase [Actinacidiphila guanduensis]